MRREMTRVRQTLMFPSYYDPTSSWKEDVDIGFSSAQVHLLRSMPSTKAMLPQKTQGNSIPVADMDSLPGLLSPLDAIAPTLLPACQFSRHILRLWSFCGWTYPISKPKFTRSNYQVDWWPQLNGYSPPWMRNPPIDADDGTS